jgi:iron-sulfur cluster assembly accessory protein
MSTNTNIASSAEPVISITEAAASQIKHLAAQDPQNAGKHLRVYVEQGGCSGLQYGLVFDEQRPNDFLVTMFGVIVLADPFSAEKMSGAVVDYSDSLNAGGFKITNPKARQSCGCGRSFEA